MKKNLLVFAIFLLVLSYGDCYQLRKSNQNDMERSHMTNQLNDFNTKIIINLDELAYLAQEKISESLSIVNQIYQEGNFGIAYSQDQNSNPTDQHKVVQQDGTINQPTDQEWIIDGEIKPTDQDMVTEKDGEIVDPEVIKNCGNDEFLPTDDNENSDDSSNQPTDQTMITEKDGQQDDPTDQTMVTEKDGKIVIEDENNHNKMSEQEEFIDKYFMMNSILIKTGVAVSIVLPILYILKRFI